MFGAMMGRLVRYGTSSSTILKSMYRDGMNYFVVILLAHLTGTITAFSGSAAAAIDGSYYFIGIKSVMCSHVTLRLRATVIDRRRHSVHSGAPALSGLS
ncbi:hypothetical protein FRB94_000521 [Tulasnella sp. JGI-2019a]|nr:hypothetical protein FRB94_000521 [Tulasnella sp. JGI-2019a]